MKKNIFVIVFVAIFSMLCINPVHAETATTPEIILSNKTVKKGEEISATIQLQDIETNVEGAFVFQASLSYDKQVFEKVKQEDFELLNQWSEFLYNPENETFILLKKQDVKQDESILKVKFRAKSDIDLGRSYIGIQNISFSSGTKDINVKEKDAGIIIEQTQPVTGNSNQTTSLNSQKPNFQGTSFTGVKSQWPIYILFLVSFFVMMGIGYILFRNYKKPILLYFSTKKGKRFFGIVGVGILFFGIGVGVYASSKKGDINDDAKIDSKDIVLLQKDLIDIERLENTKAQRADMNDDRYLTVTDLSLLVKVVENNMKYDVVIRSAQQNFYPEQNSEFLLEFDATVTNDETIVSAIVNGTEYPVEKSQQGTYFVRLNAGNEAGVKSYKITSVGLENKKQVKVNHVEKIEVLKDLVVVDYYEVEEENQNLHIKVHVKDSDHALVDGKVSVKKGNEIVHQASLSVGENSVTFVAEDNAAYTIEVSLHYDLDTNTLEQEVDHSGSYQLQKEYQFNIQYNLQVSDIKLYNQAYEEIQFVNKNEPFKLGFTSTNATKYVVEYVTINDVRYPVEERNGKYYVDIESLVEEGTTNLTIQSLTLSNGKRLDVNQGIVVEVQQTQATVQNVTITEDESANQMSVTYQWRDPDHTLQTVKTKITAADEKVVFEQDANSNSVEHIWDMGTTLSTSYKIQIIGIRETKQEVLYEKIVEAAKKVVVESATVTADKVEKNTDIEVTYTLRTNHNQPISSLTVGSHELEVNLSNGTTQVSVPSGTVAGKKRLRLSEVRFQDSVSIAVRHDLEVEVLKEKPTISDFLSKDPEGSEQTNFTFTVNDGDDSLQNIKVQLYKEDGTLIKEESINSMLDVNLMFDLEENKKYQLKVYAEYTRDVEGTQVVQEVIFDKVVQKVSDYKVTVSNLETFKETKTNYFAKGESIYLKFQSTNSADVVIEKVTINQVEYQLMQHEGAYVVELNGFEEAGVKDLRIESFIMSDGALVAAPENTIHKIEILKDKPTVSAFQYELKENRSVTFTFELHDLESAIQNAQVKVMDGNNELHTQAIQKGRNEVTFNLSTSDVYQVKFIVSYDLDTNALGSGENEFTNETLETNQIYAIQELIELKDVEFIELYKKQGSEVVLVTEVQVDNFRPQDYLAKIKMKQQPELYVEVESAKPINGKELVLVLKYDNAVYYNNDKKQSQIEVKYGDIVNGVAKNVGFEELVKQIRSNPTGEFTLTGDLDASSFNCTNVAYFGAFQGKLNGNGYTIKNLKKPLFNNVEGATIENLVISNARIVDNNQGILANTAANTTIENVHIQDSKVEVWHNAGVGAFVGKLDNNSYLKKSSANNVRVQSNKVVGGMVGHLMNSSIIEDSYIRGYVKAGSDAVGGIAGQTSGWVRIERTISDVQLDMVADWAVAGLVGYANRNRVELKHNLSLADGNKGKRVMGSTTSYNGSTTNNYEISESQLQTNADGNKVITISKNDINQEFFKNRLHWSEDVWRLNDTSASNLPTLKNADPRDINNLKNNVFPTNPDVYIPNIARLKHTEGYNEAKEIAYHNMNLLNPFYDSQFMVNNGNNIAEDHILNQKKIAFIFQYGADGRMIKGLTSDNYRNISKIRIVFEDKTTQDFTTTFKKQLNQLAVYSLNNLNVTFVPNQYILNTSINTISQLQQAAKSKDFATQIATITPEDDSRLYVDYYNESVKQRLDQIIVEILANESKWNLYLDNEILKTKVMNEFNKDQFLEKVLYTYNYIDKWYHMEMGGTPLSDVIYFLSNRLNNDFSITHLTNRTFHIGENARRTSSTPAYYDNVLKGQIPKLNLVEYLEYFMDVLTESKTPEDWFTENFHGELLEANLPDKPEFQYRAWHLLRRRFNNVLPILSAPQEDMYLLSMPSQLIIGSMNRYGQYVQGNKAWVREVMQSYADKAVSFYGTSGSFIRGAADILNEKTHMQYDTRFGFPNTGNQEKGTTQDPVIKWVYEAIGTFANPSGGAYATGTDVFWTFITALGDDYSFNAFSHENAHNQDGYYFYERRGRRMGTDAEDHADGNITQYLGDGDLVFNLKKDYDPWNPISNNLNPSRVNSPEKVHSYYKEMFETFYVLDYLSAQAFFTLHPGLQAKLVTQVSYEDDNNPDNGGRITLYKKLRSLDIMQMGLENMEDLWDNRIVFRDEGRVQGHGAYGQDSHYPMYWYQPHNDEGRPDTYSFKKLGFEMLGVGGYSDGYVIYRSRLSENDLDALRKITKDPTMTWKKYKMDRFKNVEANLQNIKLFDPNKVIELYTIAMTEDAKNGNKTLTNQLRRALFGTVKRITKDFSIGGIYGEPQSQEISSAQQLIDALKANNWGSYKLTQDIDFANIPAENGVYIDKDVIAHINGNGHKLRNVRYPIFKKLTFSTIENMVIDQPNMVPDATAILSLAGKHTILTDVKAISSNVDIPLIKTKQEGIYEMGICSVEVKKSVIRNLDELLAIGTASDPIVRKMDYVLEANIDAASVTNKTAIIPSDFGGSIDGKGYTISNLKVPLFENLTGRIENLNITNATIGNKNENNVGTIARSANNASLKKVTLDNITITGRENVGGVVGTSATTNFEMLTVKNMNVTGHRYYAGGVVGKSATSRLWNVIVQGTLNVHDTHNGGVAGSLNEDRLVNIYAKVDVNRVSNGDGRNKNGGLFGAVERGGAIVDNVVVLGNMSESVYKITPASTQQEITSIRNNVRNAFELQSTTGISNKLDNSIQTVTEERLKDKSFYTHTLYFSDKIWDLDPVTRGELPRFK